MAKIGLKYAMWAPQATEPESAAQTYGTGKVIGKMVSYNAAYSNAEGTFYADDAAAEYASEFSSADLTIETANIALEDQAMLYGAEYNGDNELALKADDTAPYGAFGGVQVLLVNNARIFRAYIYTKVKALIADEEGSTKAESISFGTQPLKLKAVAPKFGAWLIKKDFESDAAAKAYIEQKLNVASWYKINVQVNGAETGEGAAPAGVSMVASGGSFRLEITGTATKVYDNGTDKTSSISGGAYTISSMSADHNIAVIF